jgi:xanthine dehydrogenase iron-sulfur cluster and FAD-binding subunit A
MSAPKLDNDVLIAEIQLASGNLTAVARKLSVSRTTLYKHLDKKGSEKVVDALNAARESMIDMVESKLYAEALQGNTAAMIFFLKTQGRKRGYNEHISLNGGVSPNGDELPVPVSVVINAPVMPVDDKK